MTQDESLLIEAILIAEGKTMMLGTTRHVQALVSRLDNEAPGWRERIIQEKKDGES